MHDPVVYHIEEALKKLTMMGGNRERSITKTKLEEALLWYDYGASIEYITK